MASVKGLFDPVNIGTVTTRNRICIPPMVIYGYSDDSGMVTEDQCLPLCPFGPGRCGPDYSGGHLHHKRRTAVRRPTGNLVDDHIPGLKQIVQRVHAYGCPIFVQLHHAGVAGIGPDYLCPARTGFSGRRGVHTGRAMTEAEIQTVGRISFRLDGGRFWRVTTG